MSILFQSGILRMFQYNVKDVLSIRLRAFLLSSNIMSSAFFFILSMMVNFVSVKTVGF